jgi:preprotein translocase subunit SecG
VIQIYNSLTFILAINSLVLIGLILNQNDTSKESISNQNSSSSTNPFENLTWIKYAEDMEEYQRLLAIYE